MICAIHQPNFLPWLGYFNKILRSDKFVMLDNVQFGTKSKGAGLGNRVKILNNGAKWLTLTINRKDKFLQTRKVKINHDLRKTLNYIQESYKNHEFFNDFYPILEKQLNKKHKYIAGLNINLIFDILSYLELYECKKKITLQSDLKTKKQGTDLLIEICQKANADKYMCGGGAEGYQEDKKFKENGIELIYQNFQHLTYSQYKTYGSPRKFVPGLSIIDLIFNHGKKSKKYLI